MKRFSFDALAESLRREPTDVRGIAEDLAVSVRSVWRWRKSGLSYRQAELVAVKAWLHPYEVWPEMRVAAVERDAEELAKRGAACAQCGELFWPHRKGHRFCSRACQKASQQLRWRATAKGQAYNREARAAYYREAAEYERGRQRRYYWRNRETILAGRKARRAS